MTAPHEHINPLYHTRLEDPEWDALTAKVFATPDGKRWLDELQDRSSLAMFLIADIKTRIARKRKDWGQGSLRAG